MIELQKRQIKAQYPCAPDRQTHSREQPFTKYGVLAQHRL
jgi:hypothetical protein